MGEAASCPTALAGRAETLKAQKRVDNELNKEDGVVARTTALDAKLKELQKKAEAVAKEKKANQISAHLRGKRSELLSDFRFSSVLPNLQTNFNVIRPFNVLPLMLNQDDVFALLLKMRLIERSCIKAT